MGQRLGFARKEALVDLTDEGEEPQNSQPAATRNPYGTRRQARSQAGMTDLPVLSYPANDPNAVTLTRSDMTRLSPGEFLNDSLVDFYCRWVQEQRKKKLKAKDMDPSQDRLHIFTSFLYAKLSLGFNTSTEAVKWCSKIDIFEKDFLLFPVCQKLHWSLILVCYPSLTEQIQLPADKGGKSKSVPCILHFNSIRKHTSSMFGHIRTFLKVFWDTRHKQSRGDRVFDDKSMIGYNAVCPQQSNDWDCGIFLLEFIKKICLEGEEPTLQQLLDLAEPSKFFDRPKWFKTSEIENGSRREDFRELVESIQEEMVGSKFSDEDRAPSRQLSGAGSSAAMDASMANSPAKLSDLSAWRDEVDHELSATLETEDTEQHLIRSAPDMEQSQQSKRCEGRMCRSSIQQQIVFGAEAPIQEDEGRIDVESVDVDDPPCAANETFRAVGQEKPTGKQSEQQHFDWQEDGKRQVKEGAIERPHVTGKKRGRESVENAEVVEIYEEIL